MDTFTKNPGEFRHMDLISQMENISLLTETPKPDDDVTTSKEEKEAGKRQESN